MLRNFTLKQLSAAVMGAVGEIPNLASSVDDTVPPCGKLCLNCGKRSAHLWNVCGICGENCGEK